MKVEVRSEEKSHLAMMRENGEEHYRCESFNCILRLKNP